MATICKSSLSQVGLNTLYPFPKQSSSLRSRIGESSLISVTRRRRPLLVGAPSCFFIPIDEPILKEALKEPVAFMGGMFAGLLRLDLNEDPLKDWVTRTVEASGLTDEIDTEGSKQDEDVPQQIEIE